MKSFKFFITLFALFFCLAISAQETTSKDSVIIEKLRFANELILENEYVLAFQLYSECAEAGNAKAMNAIGILKQRGWGSKTKPDQ